METISVWQLNAFEAFRIYWLRTMPVDQYWQLCLAGTCGHEVEVGPYHIPCG